MNFKKHITPLIIATSLIGGTAVACQQANAPDAHQSAQKHQAPSCADRMNKLAHALELTADQQKVIQPIIQSAQQTAAPIKQQLAEERRAFMRATNSDHFDQETIDKLAQQQATSLTQLMSLRATTMHSIKETLSPEQQGKLQRIQAHKLKKMHHEIKKSH